MFSLLCHIVSLTHILLLPAVCIMPDEHFAGKENAATLRQILPLALSLSPGIFTLPLLYPAFLSFLSVAVLS